jgi:hypothetical protein
MKLNSYLRFLRRHLSFRGRRIALSPRPSPRMPKTSQAGNSQDAEACGGVPVDRQCSSNAPGALPEAGKVIQHPRCVNCHPATDRPLQGATMHPHQPPVSRGDGGMGMPGMHLHHLPQPAEHPEVIGQSETIKSIPGNPAWHLAPIEMAWVGKSLGQICQQIKDPARNGGKTWTEIVEHMAHDELVGWGWNPGAGREPVPGTQAEFGELIKAWVDTGAACE